MKKIILLSIISTLALVLSGCCTQEGNNLPTDITFTEYSLSGTSCGWTSLSYPHDSELIIINSDEELENYITCTEEDRIPSIDFSKHTLLVARGIESYDNRPGNKSLQQLSFQNYVMNVNLRPSLAAVITNWQVAIIIDKLKGEKNIELLVTREIE